MSHVLPALGVERVQVRTFHEWAARARAAACFPRCRASVREDTPAVVQRLKLHPALLAALERHVARAPGPGDAGAGDRRLGERAHRTARCSRRCSPTWRRTRSAPRSSSAPRLVPRAQRGADRLARGRPRASSAELDPEDDALLLRAWQLRVGPLPARRRPPAALPPRRDRRGAGLLAARGAGAARLPRRAPEHHARRRHPAARHRRTPASPRGATFFAHLGLEGTEVEHARRSATAARARSPSFAARRCSATCARTTRRRVTTRSGPPVELFRFTDHGACVAFLADALQERSRARSRSPRSRC